MTTAYLVCEYQHGNLFGGPPPPEIKSRTQPCFPFTYHSYVPTSLLSALHSSPSNVLAYIQ
jgi:hypothetical protein